MSYTLACPPGSLRLRMPQLGEHVRSGTVMQWLKREGDYVEEDEPLLEISTDKVDTEVPCPAAGILYRIAVPQDGTIAHGGMIAVITHTRETRADGATEPEIVSYTLAWPSGRIRVVTPPYEKFITIVRWLKREGDHVVEGEPLLQWAAGKLPAEMPCPMTGTVRRIAVRRDGVIAAGGLIAVLTPPLSPATNQR